MEVFNQMILSHDLGYITGDELAEVRIKTSEIAKMLKSLRYKLIENEDSITSHPHKTP